MIVVGGRNDGGGSGGFFSIDIAHTMAPMCSNIFYLPNGKTTNDCSSVNNIDAGKGHSIGKDDNDDDDVDGEEETTTEHFSLAFVFWKKRKKKNFKQNVMAQENNCNYR